MQNYAIFTDATVDLPDSILHGEQIQILPMEIAMEGETLLFCHDWPEERIQAFYEQLRAGKVAKTSQIAPYIYETAFEKVLQEGRDILYICFSSGLSDTIQAAQLVAKTLMDTYPDRKIRIVDSLGATFGEGLSVLRAVENRASGMDIEENARQVTENVPHCSHWFTVDDLMYLKRGGRISAATALVGSALQIKPVMHMDDLGHLVPVSKARGRKLSIKAIGEKLRQTALQPESQVAYISHGGSKQDAQFLADYLRSVVALRDIVVSPLSPVIGAHSGPGTIALFSWEIAGISLWQASGLSTNGPVSHRAAAAHFRRQRKRWRQRSADRCVRPEFAGSPAQKPLPSFNRESGFRLSKKPVGRFPPNRARRRVRRARFFPERKRRKNNSFGQEIARKIRRFSDFRSPFLHENPQIFMERVEILF